MYHKQLDSKWLNTSSVAEMCGFTGFGEIQKDKCYLCIAVIPLLHKCEKVKKIITHGQTLSH